MMGISNGKSSNWLFLSRFPIRRKRYTVLQFFKQVALNLFTVNIVRCFFIGVRIYHKISPNSSNVASSNTYTFDTTTCNQSNKCTPGFSGANVLTKLSTNLGHHHPYLRSLGFVTSLSFSSHEDVSFKMRVFFFGAKELLLLQQTIKALEDFRVLLGDEELQSLELRRFNDLRDDWEEMWFGGAMFWKFWDINQIQNISRLLMEKWMLKNKIMCEYIHPCWLLSISSAWFRAMINVKRWRRTVLSLCSTYKSVNIYIYLYIYIYDYVLYGY